VGSRFGRDGATFLRNKEETSHVEAEV